MSISLLLVSLFTFVEFNCENLFDTVDDSLKQDEEFLPASSHHWTPYRYWRKLDRIGQALLSCGVLGERQVLPDMMVLAVMATILMRIALKSTHKRIG